MAIGLFCSMAFSTVPTKRDPTGWVVPDLGMQDSLAALLELARSPASLVFLDLPLVGVDSSSPKRVVVKQQGLAADTVVRTWLDRTHVGQESSTAQGKVQCQFKGLLFTCQSQDARRVRQEDSSGRVVSDNIFQSLTSIRSWNGDNFGRLTKKQSTIMDRDTVRQHQDILWATNGVSVVTRQWSVDQEPVHWSDSTYHTYTEGRLNRSTTFFANGDQRTILFTYNSFGLLERMEQLDGDVFKPTSGRIFRYRYGNSRLLIERTDSSWSESFSPSGVQNIIHWDERGQRDTVTSRSETGFVGMISMRWDNRGRLLASGRSFDAGRTWTENIAYSYSDSLLLKTSPAPAHAGHMHNFNHTLVWDGPIPEGANITVWDLSGRQLLHSPLQAKTVVPGSLVSPIRWRITYRPGRSQINE